MQYLATGKKENIENITANVNNTQNKVNSHENSNMKQITNLIFDEKIRQFLDNEKPKYDIFEAIDEMEKLIDTNLLKSVKTESHYNIFHNE